MQDGSAVFSITQPPGSSQASPPIHWQAIRFASCLVIASAVNFLWSFGPDAVLLRFQVPAPNRLLDAASISPCTHLCDLKHIGIWVAEEYGRPAAHGLGELHIGILQASHQGLNGLHTCSMHTSVQLMKRDAGAGRTKNAGYSRLPMSVNINMSHRSSVGLEDKRLRRAIYSAASQGGIS